MPSRGRPQLRRFPGINAQDDPSEEPISLFPQPRSAYSAHPGKGHQAHGHKDLFLHQSKPGHHYGRVTPAKAEAHAASSVTSFPRGTGQLDPLGPACCTGGSILSSQEQIIPVCSFCLQCFAQQCYHPSSQHLTQHCLPKEMYFIRSTYFLGIEFVALLNALTARGSWPAEAVAWPPQLSCEPAERWPVHSRDRLLLTGTSY